MAPWAWREPGDGWQVRRICLMRQMHVERAVDDAAHRHGEKDRLEPHHERNGRWGMGGRQRATASRKRSVMTAVGYVRVSTEEQVLGLEAQRVALARWAEAREIRLVVVHEDRGVSGAADLDRRPGLLAALGSLEQHNAGFSSRPSATASRAT